MRQAIIIALLLPLCAVAQKKKGPPSEDDKPAWTGKGDQGDFVIIREGIRDSTTKIAQYKAADAYREILGNLQRFRAIKQRVADAKNVDDVIDEITDGLDAIAASYERIAGLKEDVLGTHDDEVRSLGGLKDNTVEIITGIKERRTAHRAEMARLEKLLETEEDSTERRKAQVSIKALRSQINSLNAKERIWNKFSQAQKRLLDRLGTNRKNVDLLLHVLQENAKVYRSAASVAKLRKSARHALKQLSDLADLQGVLGDLEASWREVDGLVDEISAADFDLDLDGGPAVDRAK